MRVVKRQVEELAIRSAVDFDADHGACSRAARPLDDVLVLFCDSKGIVMRPEALRDGARKAGAETRQQLTTRLSRGEKGESQTDGGDRLRRRSRAGSPDARADCAATRLPRGGPTVPKAKAKWVTAGVVGDAFSVVAQIFAEAERRDPDHQRTWIALVDGDNHQIDLINREARKTSHGCNLPGPSL